MFCLHRENRPETGPEFEKSAARVPLLDELRGVCICLMVLYHSAYDIVYLFGVDIPAFHWPILRFAQPFVAGIFIVISGVACRYSRSNLRRGCIALGLGLGVSAVTILTPGLMGIYFGILHLLGSSMILFHLLRPALDRVPPPAGMAFFGLLTLLTYRMSHGWFGVPHLWNMELPARWREYAWGLPLGLSGAGADYFPLMPWLFLFLAGSFLGVYFKQGRMPALFYRSHLPWIGTVGRHTIYIYILHQPVVFGVLWVFFAVMRGVFGVFV